MTLNREHNGQRFAYVANSQEFAFYVRTIAAALRQNPAQVIATLRFAVETASGKFWVQ